MDILRERIMAVGRVPAYYDEHVVVGRKAIFRWRASQRWPETWHQTHGPAGAEEPVIHGLVFRDPADAASWDTAYLASDVRPQPLRFDSWDDALAWVNSNA